MIITVTLTPALDKTVILPDFCVDRVNRIQSLRLDAGGKGINVSKVLKSLGTDSLATGILGGSTGRFIEEKLKEEDIACDFAWVDQDTRTNLKVVDPLRHTNTDINEPGAQVSVAVLESVFRKAAAAAKPGDIVVLAGKAPSGADPDLFGLWTNRLKALGIRVYLDADGDLLQEGVRACPALIKPNDQELSRLMGRELKDLSQITEAARQLVESGVGTTVVSLGGDGALFVTADRVLRGHGLKVQVQSTVGAGDSMMAALAHGASRGLPFRDTCALAMAVSAAAVTTPGTQPADPDTVHALLKQVVIEEIPG